MPIASYEIAVPARFAFDRYGKPRAPARVTLFTCEGCGGPAHFGIDGSPLRASREGDADLAGKWFCGSIDGEPTCLVTGEMMMRSEPAPPAPAEIHSRASDAAGEQGRLF